MATKSAKSIRIRGLPSETTEQEVQTIAAVFLKCEGNAVGSRLVNTSLGLQEDTKTATITFQKQDEKKKAKQRKDKVTKLAEVDDRFLNLTVLYSPNDHDLDICAVHGLNGNAFDTWMADNGRMWLHDFLPKDPPFDRSRIMTFGYESTLVDTRKLTDRFEDYADQLIREIIRLRGSNPTRKRPIIFVCHSMGGLVARLAMTRMHSLPNKFKGLSLEECGILFLSTPHLGSLQADRSPFIVALGEGLVGLRTGVVKELQSFNASSVDNTDMFQAMKVKPVFQCFCESEPTRVLAKDRLVVTQVSAGFLNQSAEKILGTDHHTVCKFKHRYDGYKGVLDGLKMIRNELAMRLATSQAGPSNFSIPGYPSVTANSFPPYDKHFLGVDKYRQRKFVGRTKLLEDINGRLINQSESIAIVGIGGIGKTELLLEIASQRRGLQNIFFLPASDVGAYQKAVNEMAQVIGHDILKDRHSYPELHQLWTNLGQSGQAREFKKWLSSRQNHDGLIILDDLDGLRTDEAILECLPDGAKSIIYSARDPTIATSRLLRCEPISVPPMDATDIKQLLEAESKGTGLALSLQDLEGVAVIADGHPLAASRAISYMEQLAFESSGLDPSTPARSFIGIFDNSDWKSRNEFLDHKIHFGSSIREIFETSIQRLDQTKSSSIVQLLNALGFICGSKPNCLDYYDFLAIERPWIDHFKIEVPDYELFKTGMRGKGGLFHDLVKVSLAFRPFPDRALLRFHPIWLECIRQRCGAEGREVWLKQILFLCCETKKHSPEKSDVMDRYAENCLNIAHDFDIDFEVLATSEDSRRWIVRKSKQKAR